MICRLLLDVNDFFMTENISASQILVMQSTDTGQILICYK